MPATLNQIQSSNVPVAYAIDAWAIASQTVNDLSPEVARLTGVVAAAAAVVAVDGPAEANMLTALQNANSALAALLAGTPTMAQVQACQALQVTAQQNWDYAHAWTVSTTLTLTNAQADLATKQTALTAAQATVAAAWLALVAAVGALNTLVNQP